MEELTITNKTNEDFIIINPLFDESKKENISQSKITAITFKYPLGENVLANVNEYEEEYEIEMLAPGFAESDIEFEVDENNVLTVLAESTDSEDKYSNLNCMRNEFIIRSFRRSFQLPDDVESDEISAVYKNGIINLFIPKTDDLSFLETLESIIE
jgi:HSP20 family molecular chaperone IbpA